ncbi:MAG: flagellin, partial [Asticcacaulis sp. 32-58-5]
MALNSVNTNVGAAIALQNLNKTNSMLATTQERINTGLKVGSAKDNGAIFAIAQSQRSEIS